MRLTITRTLSWTLGVLLVMNPFLYGGLAFAGETIRVNTSATSGSDAILQQDNPTTTVNGTTLQVQSTTTGTPNQNWRSIVSFDLSPLAGSSVKVASLGLRMTGAPAVSRTYQVFRLTQSWAEAQVSWQQRSTGPIVNWTTPGGTSDGILASSVATGTISNVDLTFGGIRSDSSSSNFVQGWLDTPANNFGFLIRDSAEDTTPTRTATFSSRTGTTPPWMDVVVARNVTWGAVSAPTPSMINMAWTFPAGSTGANYDGVLITGAVGAAGPTGTPLDGTTYTVGQTVGTGTVVVNTSSFATVSTSIENGDQVSIAPGVQYTLRAYTHDANSIAGAASVAAPHYSPGVASASVITPTILGAWSYATGAATLAPPAPTGSGTIVIGGNDNRVRAIDDTNGVKKYVPAGALGDAGGAVTDRPTVIPGDFTSDPTCAGLCDVIYVSSGDGRVHAFRSDTGVQLWQSAVLTVGGGTLVGSPAVQLAAFASGGFPHVFDLLVVGTRNTGSATNNRVYGLNANTGAVVWTFAPGNLDIVNSTPYIDYETNSAWVTSYSNSGTQPSIWRLNTGTTNPAGSLAASITPSTTNKNIPGSPTLDFDGVILYALTEGGDLVLINTATNTERTALAIGGVGGGYPLVYEDPQAVDHVVVATSTGIHKRTYTPSTQTFGAAWDNGSFPGASVPVFSSYPPSFVYAGSTDGNLYKLSMTDGTATNLTINAGSTIGSPAFDEVSLKICVGDTSGHIYSFPF